MKNVFFLLISVLTTGLVNAQLPEPGFVIDDKTAMVMTDPQNDFLSEKGVAWGVVGESVKKNGTIENMETIFKLAKEHDMQVFVSPHWYYPTDHKWQFEGVLEVLMHSIHMFDRKGQLNLDGFEGSGADWLPLYKPYLNGDNIVISNPHKIYGPESNDLALQLRKRGINKVILSGMSANLCTESHMRDLVEAGFEVAVVIDATAAAITPELNGYEAAVTNFKMIASKTFTTKELVEELKNN